VVRHGLRRQVRFDQDAKHDPLGYLRSPLGPSFDIEAGQFYKCGASHIPEASTITERTTIAQEPLLGTQASTIVFHGRVFHNLGLAEGGRLLSYHSSTF
jgi:hypothetical protein